MPDGDRHGPHARPDYSSFPGPTDDYHGTEGSGIGVSDRFAILLEP